MSEEPAKKRRKQSGDETNTLDDGKPSIRAIKRVERANDPALFPQVVLQVTFANIQKKYYRQRAHANVLSDHALE
jgi:hypothetical protein